MILEPFSDAHFEDLARLRLDPVVMAQMMSGAETGEETCANSAFAQAGIVEAAAISQASNAASLRVPACNNFRCLRHECRNSGGLKFFAL